MLALIVENRRPIVSRTYSCIDSMPRRLRALLNLVMFDDSQIVQIYEVWRSVGEERTIGWLEMTLDAQMPGWREWR